MWADQYRIYATNYLAALSAYSEAAGSLAATLLWCASSW